MPPEIVRLWGPAGGPLLRSCWGGEGAGVQTHLILVGRDITPRDGPSQSYFFAPHQTQIGADFLLLLLSSNLFAQSGKARHRPPPPKLLLWRSLSIPIFKSIAGCQPELQQGKVLYEARTSKQNFHKGQNCQQTRLIFCRSHR